MRAVVGADQDQWRNSSAEEVRADYPPAEALEKKHDRTDKAIEW